MTGLRCSWCGVGVDPDDGYRAAEPAGSRLAVFCRLEHPDGLLEQLLARLVAFQHDDLEVVRHGRVSLARRVVADSAGSR